MPVPDPSVSVLAATDTAKCGAVLRSLSSAADYEQCLDLQRATWGEDFRELVPPTILKIGQKVGGVVAGAFEDESMLGFVYGLSGVREGRPVHWSHMLAVHEQHRGRGVGRDLKLFQRRLLGVLGIDVMFWSFDPLIARNAGLNLISLGARPVEYVCDMYGADTGSELHSGLGTDRFIARWNLNAEVRESSTAAKAPAPPAEAIASRAGMKAGGISWVEIPADIDQLKRDDPDRAAQWRTQTRTALLGELTDGRACIGLHRDSSDRYFYVFAETGGELG